MAVDHDLFERNLIGGEWRFPKAPYDYEIRSPADSRVIATVPLSSRLDVAMAVDAARQARPAWSDPNLRARVRSQFEGVLRAHSFDLAELQAAETGLALRHSSALVLGALSITQSTGSSNTERIASGPLAPTPQGHILGWGWPLLDVAVSALEPLFAGACLVVKPSLRSPLSAAALGQLLVESGLPAGAFNVVQGLGTDVGAALIAHHDVASVTIRGSTATVERIATATRRRGAQVACSTGGQQVLVVGPDADVERATAAISSGVAANSAGGPLGLDRVIVHAELEHDLVEACRGIFDDLEPAPLGTEAMRRRVVTELEAVTRSDAAVVAGGLPVPDDVRHRMGWYVPPSLITGHTGGPRLPPLDGPVVVLDVWSETDQVCIGPDDLGVAVGIDAAELEVSSTVFEEESLHDLVCRGRIAAGWRNRPWSRQSGADPQ